MQMPDPYASLGDRLTELLQVEKFPPSAGFAAAAQVRDPAVYRQAADDPAAWWATQARERLHWDRPFTSVLDDRNPPFYTWFDDGTINASYNCLDRHVLAGRGDRVAFHWRGEEGEERDLTYAGLLDDVQRLANALRAQGVEKGDVVAIYLPMIPEVVVAMLACARIGAPHTVVFGGFAPTAVRERMEVSRAKALITADGARRKGKPIPVKQQVDEVITDLPDLETVVVVRAAGAECVMRPGRDVWFDDLIASADPACPAEPMEAEHPLFLLYSSGSTAKPKGILHTTGGYLTGVTTTTAMVFDLDAGRDVFWCTADVGWITGHSYIVYGPMANGCTSVMFEGAPDYPDKDIWWEIVERYGVTIFYTAPTAIRACMKWGEEYPAKRDLSSLRLLGSVGEPINPKAWLWYHTVIGGERCPIVDTWWQTETGAIMVGQPPPAGRVRRSGGRVGGAGRAGQWAARADPALAEHAPHPVWRPRALRADLLLPVRSSHLLRRRRRAARPGRLFLDHRAGRRRHQRIRPPAVHRRDRIGPGLPPRGRRSRGDRRPG
jgi:acetyl-CoA synthetase